jgi:hypothetical protein
MYEDVLDYVSDLNFELSDALLTDVFPGSSAQDRLMLSSLALRLIRMIALAC